MKREIYAEIHKINIHFTAQDEEVEQYIRREVKCHEIKAPALPGHIVVSFENDRFNSPVNAVRVNDNALLSDMSVSVRIAAHFRKTWIEISGFAEPCTMIRVFLNKKQKGTRIKQFFTPNFQMPWQNSMVDFFHGLFLAVLQYKLLGQGASLLHAAAFGNNAGSSLIAADAAAGKSTLVDAFVHSYGYCFIAEDYCIADEENNVHGLFNQRRIHYGQLSALKGNGEVPYSDRTGSRMNAWLFRRMSFLGLESIRILSVQELFRESQIKGSSAIRSIIQLKRGENSITEAEAATSQAAAVMKEEMKNWDGAEDLFLAYEKLHHGRRMKAEFFMQTERVIREIMQKNDVNEWCVPYMETSEEFIAYVYGLYGKSNI